MTEIIYLHHAGPTTWVQKMLSTVAHISAKSIEWSPLQKEDLKKICCPKESIVALKKSEVILFDPFAIALYSSSDTLARRGVKNEESQVLQWMYFAGSEILSARFLSPKEVKEKKWANRSEVDNPYLYMRKIYVALDKYLKSRSFLLDKRLSLADVILAYSMSSLPLHSRLEAALNNVHKWLKRVEQLCTVANDGSPQTDRSIAVQRKLKILCLHGYQQDAKLFHQKIGGLRKKWKNRVDFDYLNAPHLIPTEEGNVPPTFGWWLHPRTAASAEERQTRFLEELELSLISLDDKLVASGPFDGLLAFSQGSCFAILHCLYNLKKARERNLLDFYVFIAGFLPRRFNHPSFVNDIEKANVSSLHVMGKSDGVIGLDLSLKAAEKFNNPAIIKHNMGHLVPTQSDATARMLQFVTKHQAN